MDVLQFFSYNFSSFPTMICGVCFYCRRQADKVSFVFVFPGIAEEGLLLEDIEQTTAVETAAIQELPEEHPATELPEDVMLPEPAVDAEASGELEDLLWPTEAAEEKKVLSSEETLVEETDATSEDDTVTVTENSPAESVTIGNPFANLIANEVLKQPESFPTQTTSTGEEESLPALVQPPEVVDTVEVSEPESPETSLLDEDLMDKTGVEVLPEENVRPDNVDMNVVLSNSELSETGDEPIFEDHGLQEATAGKGQDLETTVVDPEILGHPLISEEDLTEDEILLLNLGEPEPPITDSLEPVEPTPLSPEKESPFTRIGDADPASEGQPDILEEVKKKINLKTNGDLVLLLQMQLKKQSTKPSTAKIKPHVQVNNL